MGLYAGQRVKLKDGKTYIINSMDGQDIEIRHGKTSQWVKRGDIDDKRRAEDRRKKFGETRPHEERMKKREEMDRKHAKAQGVRGGRPRKRAYVVPRGGRYGGGSYYGVRAGKTEKAPLIKDFYDRKDAERFRDMVNGKIPKDKWFEDQF